MGVTRQHFVNGNHHKRLIRQIQQKCAPECTSYCRCYGSRSNRDDKYNNMETKHTQLSYELHRVVFALQGASFSRQKRQIQLYGNQAKGSIIEEFPYICCNPRWRPKPCIGLFRLSLQHKNTYYLPELNSD